MNTKIPCSVTCFQKAAHFLYQTLWSRRHVSSSTQKLSLVFRIKINWVGNGSDFTSLPQIRCVYLAFGYGGWVKELQSILHVHSWLERNVLCVPFTWSSMLYLLMQLFFKKSAWGQCCWAWKCAKMFDLNRLFSLRWHVCIFQKSFYLWVWQQREGFFKV